MPLFEKWRSRCGKFWGDWKEGKTWLIDSGFTHVFQTSGESAGKLSNSLAMERVSVFLLSVPKKKPTERSLNPNLPSVVDAPMLHRIKVNVARYMDQRRGLRLYWTWWWWAGDSWWGCSGSPCSQAGRGTATGLCRSAQLTPVSLDLGLPVHIHRGKNKSPKNKKICCYTSAVV